MSIEEAFGIVIRRLRRERDLSQDRLSSISSLDRAFISKIEGGKQQPSLVTIFELASALNVTVSRIMVEVECILKFNGQEIFKPGQEKFKIDWISCLENIMTELNFDYKGNETILLVDDEKQLRDMLSDYLSQYGYGVILAEDGQDAIEKYTHFRDQIDLIVMDIVMPRKDGIESFREITKIHPDAKIIFVSGYSNSNLSELNEYQILSKPFNPLEIIKNIRKSLAADTCARSS